MSVKRVLKGIVGVLGLWSSVSHAATVPNSCAKALELLCSDEPVEVADLSGDDLKQLFDCANQPTAQLDVNDRIYLNDQSQNTAAMDLNYCSGYKIKGSTFEVSLFSQKFAIPVLKDSDGKTRYVATVGASLLGLTPSDFHFTNGRYLQSFRDLVYFVADEEAYKPLLALTDQLSPSEETRPETTDTPDTVDDDQDGYSEADGDCNDRDAAINPAAFDRVDGFTGEYDDDPDYDTNCDGVDGSATWRSLGELGLYAAFFDGYRDVFSGLYSDFVSSPQIAYTYNGQSFSTRASTMVYGLSFVQELLDEVTESCGDPDELDSCERLLDLLYVARAALSTDGSEYEVGYLSADYRDGTYASALANGITDGVSLWDAVSTDWQVNGYGEDASAEADPEIDPNAVYSSDCSAPENGAYQIPESAVSTANSLVSLASDPNAGTPNVIENLLRKLMCVPQGDGSFTCESLAGSYVDRVRELISSVFLNDAEYPNLSLHDAVGWGLYDDGTGAFLSASNLRAALGRINESVWKVSDAFSRAYASDEPEGEAAPATCMDGHTPVNALDEFYCGVCAYDSSKDMYTCLYEHFSDVADEHDQVETVAEHTTMQDYLNGVVEPVIDICGSVVSNELGELCTDDLLWDYDTKTYSALYLNDIEGMLTAPAVAKVYKMYTTLGHLAFHGFYEDAQVYAKEKTRQMHLKIYDLLVDQLPSGLTASSDDDDEETGSSQDAIDDLIASDNPTLDKLDLALHVLYTAQPGSATGWAPVAEVSSALNALRAMMGTVAGTDKVPLNSLLQVLTRVAMTERPTSNLDVLLHQTADLLGSCESTLARGLAKIEAMSSQVSLAYYPLIWSGAPIDGTASDTTEAASSVSESLSEARETYAPLMENSTPLYQSLLVLRDPGFGHYLFRDKDGAQTQLDNPLFWLNDNIVKSGLSAYVEQALKLLVDAGAYPNTYWVGQEMPKSADEPTLTEETPRDPNLPTPPPPRTAGKQSLEKRRGVR